MDYTPYNGEFTKLLAVLSPDLDWHVSEVAILAVKSYLGTDKFYECARTKVEDDGFITVWCRPKPAPLPAVSDVVKQGTFTGVGGAVLGEGVHMVYEYHGKRYKLTYETANDPTITLADDVKKAGLREVGRQVTEKTLYKEVKQELRPVSGGLAWPTHEWLERNASCYSRDTDGNSYTRCFYDVRDYLNKKYVVYQYHSPSTGEHWLVEEVTPGMFDPENGIYLPTVETLEKHGSPLLGSLKTELLYSYRWKTYKVVSKPATAKTVHEVK